MIIKSLFSTVVVQGFSAKQHISGAPRVTIHVCSSDKTDGPKQMTIEAARALAEALIHAADDAEDPMDDLGDEIESAP